MNWLSRPNDNNGNWTASIDRLGQYTVIALAFAVPISTALSNVFLGLVLFCWLASGRYKEKLSLFIQSPIALAALLLFAWLFISLAWANSFDQDQIKFLRKYSNLLMVTIFLSFLLNPVNRSRALFAFAISMLLTLTLSYAAAAELLPSFSWLHAAPGNAVVFRLHITHNLFMALAALLFGVFAVEARLSGRRFFAAAWAIACVLALINVVLMVQGRTGYVVLAAFIALVFGLRAGWKGIAVACLAVCFSAFVIYELSDSTRQRVNLALTELSQWQPAKPVTDGNSIGHRMEFFTNSLALIDKRPLLGSGLGSFPSEYKQYVEGTGRDFTDNPHNDVLLLAVQAGIPSVLLFLYLLIRLGFGAKHTTSPQLRVLAPALALWIGVGGTFNALLIDHAESLLFALLLGLIAAATLPSKNDKVSKAASALS
jgi:O-antigen ligase